MSDPNPRVTPTPTTAGLVVRNTIANWSFNIANLAIVFFLTPYVLGCLGDERFGMFTISRQALAYVSLLTLGMRSAVNRFICRDIISGEIAALNTTLSTLATLYISAGMIGLGVCGGLGFLAPSFFALTPAYANETIVLFVAMGGMFLLDLIAFSYKSLLIGHQRYDLLNAGEILKEVSRAGLIFLLFATGWKSLSSLGFATVAAFVLGLAYFWVITHRQQPGLRVNPLRPSKSSAKEVVGFSAWNGIIQVGNVVTFATPAFIVARALGADQVVFFSVPFLLADRLRIFVVSMANTLSPIAAGALATGNRAQLRSLIIKGCRAAAVMCMPIGGIIYVFCRQFLALWMGEAYAWSWVVFAIMMAAMFGRISQTPTLYVLVGGGRIRGLAWIQIASSIATVAGSLILAAQTDLGVAGVAIGIAVPLFFSHSVGVPWYASKQIGVSLWSFYRQVYGGPVLSTLPGVGVAFLLSRVWFPSNYWIMAVEFAAALGVSAVLAWHLCLDESIRRRFKNRIPGLRSR